MEYTQKTVMLKNGKACVIRRVEESDTERMVQYLKQTCGETPYLIRGPEEVRLTTEEEAAMLREGNRDPNTMKYQDGSYADFLLMTKSLL